MSLRPGQLETAHLEIGVRHAQSGTTRAKRPLRCLEIPLGDGSAGGKLSRPPHLGLCKPELRLRALQIRARQRFGRLGHAELCRCFSLGTRIEQVRVCRLNLRDSRFVRSQSVTGLCLDSAEASVGRRRHDEYVRYARLTLIAYSHDHRAVADGRDIHRVRARPESGA